MPFAVRLKLSVMMFLEYFVWGAWYVDDGDLARVSRLFRRADRPDLRHHRAGGDDLAVLRRDDCRPLLCDAAAPCRPPCSGRAGHSLRVDAHDVLAALHGHPGPYALLHADARADEFSVVPADAGSRPRVPADPRPRHDRLDRRRPSGRHDGRRSHVNAAAARRRWVVRARRVLSRASAYASTENGSREREDVLGSMLSP